MEHQTPLAQSHGSWVDLLLDEQRTHWKAGKKKCAEEYIATHPALADDPEAALDLIYQEFYLRREAGD